MVVFCLFLLLVLLFLFLFLVVVVFFNLLSIPSWRRCPLPASSLSAFFCLLSLLLSELVSGLIWSDSVYLVTTHGWVRSGLVDVR